MDTARKIAKVLKQELTPGISERRIEEIVAQVLDLHLLDASTAASYLGLSTYTLLAKARRLEIASVRDGRYIRFRLQDLERWVEERTTKKWVRDKTYILSKL